MVTAIRTKPRKRTKTKAPWINSDGTINPDGFDNDLYFVCVNQSASLTLSELEIFVNKISKEIKHSKSISLVDRQVFAIMIYLLKRRGGK